MNEEYEKRKVYLNRYVKDNYKQFCLRFRMDSEADVIKFLIEKPNTAEYIRDLIRKDMEQF